ncbi:MAG: GNAT family N-acetyltransferase [Ktedonobacterales bacterium]|nr:GNAT family N-acetyltransferase [Ktedonobacterales bacterium]
MDTDETGWRITLEASDAVAYAALARDRLWNCFAIADLAPPFRAYSQVAVATHAASGQNATCLVLRHPAFTVLAPDGAEEGVAALLARLDLPARTLIQVRARHLPALNRYYTREADWREVLRMAVAAETLLPPSASAVAAVERLTPADLPELRALYALAAESTFNSDQVEQGVYYGIRANGHLLAAGGTHAIAPTYGIAVLGGIFTHPNARGQGYASTLTAALAVDLFARGCRDVALNAFAENHPAIRVYTRLGFRTHSHYWAGPARRTRSAPHEWA